MEVVAITAATMAASLMAVGQVRQGYQQGEQLNYQASMADRTAGMEQQKAAASEIEAQQEQIKGEMAYQEHEKKTRALLGEFIGKTAGRGVKITGSPLEYLGSTSEDLALEGEQIKYGADIASWNKRREGQIHLDQAKILNAEAGVYRTQASEAPMAGWLKGLGTLGLATYNIYGKPPIGVPGTEYTSSGMKIETLSK